MKQVPFDQYQRYKNSQEIIDALRKDNQTFTILEVGANEHRNLEGFLPHDKIMYLDIEVPDHLKSHPDYIEADATNMPLEDNAFDFIVTLDVYEHIPMNLRNQFIDELFRVSKYGFILAAPFSTEGVADAEIRANIYYKTLYGEGYRWLEEHRENGLPSLDETLLYMDKNLVPHVCFAHGSLYLWEKYIRMHFMVASNSNLYEYRFMLDDFYNKELYNLDYSLPCYRHFIVSVQDEESLKVLERRVDFNKNKHIDNLRLEKLLELEQSLYSLSSIELLNRSNTQESEEHYMQLFIDQGNGYIEKESIVQNIDTHSYRVEFELSNITNIKEIRLDPAEIPVVLSLKQIEFIYHGHDVGAKLISTNAAAVHQDLYIFDDYDPQMYYELHAQHIDKVIIKLNYLSFDKNSSSLLSDIVRQSQQKLESSLEELVWTQKELARTQSQITQMQNELTKVPEMLDSISEELAQTKMALTQKNQEISSVLESKSWKLTRPIRLTADLIKTVKRVRGLTPCNLKKSVSILKKGGPKSLFSKLKKLNSPGSPYKPERINSYQNWILDHEIKEKDKKNIQMKIEGLSYKPLFSVIIPVYNVEEQWLHKCIESVQNQLYPYWELCIVDDASTDPHIQKMLEKYAANDKRIKVVYRKENGHISAASNSALEIASGEFIALLDNDDELTPDALYENALLLNTQPDADMIYSDEDKIDINGERKFPLFKPDWSPDLLYSQMYTCHLGVYRTKLVRDLGGFRLGFEGSQDYDLVLRISELTNKIYHIPKILYSWREIETSTAINATSKPYAQDAALRALNEHLSKMYGGGNAWVEVDDQMFVYNIRYKLPESLPKVSIIIPTKDKIELLRPCVDSILTKTTYENYEILILNNNSELDETFNWFKSYQASYSNIRVIDANYDFNWSKLNNHGIKESYADVFVFLNNDTIIISEDWLERLTEKTLRENVGTVGALLLYEDGTIQHAGVVVGMGGWADHVYKGMLPLHFGSPFISPMVTRNVAASTGACLAISRKTIEKIGLFDENFIICGSDVEICLRAIKNGLVNIYDPHVKLNHLESKTRSTYIPEGDFILSEQHYSPYREEGDPYYNQNLDKMNPIPMVK